MLCLVVLTANAIPAPQGPIERVLERAIERGVARAEYDLERGGGLGRSRGGYGQDGNYGNYNNNYPLGGGIGSGSVYPGQSYFG